MRLWLFLHRHPSDEISLLVHQHHLISRSLPPLALPRLLPFQLKLAVVRLFDWSAWFAFGDRGRSGGLMSVWLKVLVMMLG